MHEKNQQSYVLSYKKLLITKIIINELKSSNKKNAKPPAPQMRGDNQAKKSHYRKPNKNIIKFICKEVCNFS